MISLKINPAAVMHRDGEENKKQSKVMKIIFSDFIIKEMHVHLCKLSSSVVNSVNTAATAVSSNFLMFFFCCCNSTTISFLCSVCYEI